MRQGWTNQELQDMADEYAKRARFAAQQPIQARGPKKPTGFVWFIFSLFF